MIKFYGVVEDAIEFSYAYGYRCVLFSCKWFDLDKHKVVKIANDLMSINVEKLWYENEPYVLENHVS